jgi:CubicO group peptidase (beta-lactamase class C family)
VRGEGHHITPFWLTASPATFGTVGGGSTMWMVDPERDLTFVYLSAGFRKDSTISSVSRRWPIWLFRR